MKGFLILALMLTMLVAFTPTMAEAATNYDYANTMSLDCLDAVASEADSGGSLFAESSQSAKFDEVSKLNIDAKDDAPERIDRAAPGGGELDSVACRPLRAIFRGIGRGFGRAFGRAGSC